MYDRHGVRDERSVMPSRKFSRPETRAVNNSRRDLQCKTRPAEQVEPGGGGEKNYRNRTYLACFIVRIDDMRA